MSRRQRFVRVLIAAGGLCFLSVDAFKAGFQLTAHLPQSEAWEQLNALAFVAEGFLGLNIGNLLPGHSWAILGLAMIAVAIWGMKRLGRLGDERMEMRG